MPIYWVNIDVKFEEPMELEDEENGVTTYEKIYGYLQNLGATFPSEKTLKSAIAKLVYEDEYMNEMNVEIIFDYIGIIPPSQVQKEIYKDRDIAYALRSEPMNDGIWYRTGRGFYSDEE